MSWRKLLLNVVVNPITALTLQRQAVLRHADVYALCLEILDEAVTVARADGARLAGDEAARIMATLMSYAPELGTSMYFDRLAGRTLEIEALTGAIVTCAERHGIRVPVNRAMLALLRAVSDAASKARGFAPETPSRALPLESPPRAEPLEPFSWSGWTGGADAGAVSDRRSDTAPAS